LNEGILREKEGLEMEELIDEVDRTGKVIATHPASRLKERMFMHSVSLVIPISADNKILISRRAKGKYPYPDTWCCCIGGKSSSGESGEETAAREMEEEIGRTYPVRKIASFVYDEEDYKAVFNLFTTKIPVDPAGLVLNPKEIQYSKAFTPEEVMKMLKERPWEFAPTFIIALREFVKVMGFRPS
jgi:isopentenyldiphosphate isomerase